MNKENLISKFKITEEQYDDLFNEQMKKFKKIFANKSEEDIKVHAENSMISALQRKIISGAKTSEILILGKFPTVSFNRIRMLVAKKLRDNKTDEQDLSSFKDPKGLPYFNEEGQIIDKWNNVINENDPTAKDEHMFWGLDGEKKIFIGRMLGSNDINNIQVGKVYSIEHRKSKKQNTIFGVSPRNIDSMILSKDQVPAKEVIDIYNNTAFDLIKENLRMIKSISDLENTNTNDLVAIEGNVFDIADNGFDTIIRVLKEDSLDKYIGCHIQKPFDTSIMRFVTIDSPVKIIGQRGFQKDNTSEEIKIDSISMWCNKEDYTDTSTNMDVEIKEADKEKMQDW